jgi:hypothetical protein
VSEAAADFRKSSFCKDAACVEVALTDTIALVRDSKNVKLSALRFSRSAWSHFVRGVASGEFDLMAR